MFSKPLFLYGNIIYLNSPNSLNEGEIFLLNISLLYTVDRISRVSHSTRYRNVCKDRNFPHLAIIVLNHLRTCRPITRPVTLYHIYYSPMKLRGSRPQNTQTTGISFLSTYISNVDTSYRCSLKVYILLPELESGPCESSIWTPVGDMVHVERGGGRNVVHPCNCDVAGCSVTPCC